MKKEKNDRMMAGGSYTVEAALVFPVIFLIFISMLYMIFYIHDRYILLIYANRMAQESCWLFMENENQPQKRSNASIVQEVAAKYEHELQEQLLMTELTTSLGTCKKNILTHLYTSTWRVIGKTAIPLNLSPFNFFSDIVFEADESRVHIRKWIYTKEIEKGIGE